MSEIDKLRTYLQNISVEENIIEQLLPHFKLKKYQKSNFFSQVGDDNLRVGFIVNGFFYQYILKEDGEIFVNEFFQPDSFISCVFRWGKESDGFIECLRDAIVLEADYLEISNILSKSKAFAYQNSESINSCVKNINNRLESFATMEARERYNIFLEKFENIEKEIPQYLIASYLGITPTQLSRIKKITNN